MFVFLPDVRIILFLCRNLQALCPRPPLANPLHARIALSAWKSGQQQFAKGMQMGELAKGNIAGTNRPGPLQRIAMLVKAQEQ